MTALRAKARDLAEPIETSLSPEESSNPLFKRAIDAVFALDERGYRLDLSVQDQPYEALLKISESLHQFGLSHNMADEFIEAIESQAVHVGVDFTKKAKPTPMEISLYIMDKEPELSDDQDHYIVAWDGLQKFGGDYHTDTVVEMHIDGTRSTRSNVPKFEDMFKIGGKKYLTVHLKKLKDSGGQTLDEKGAELATFVEAVGPVAAGSAGGGAMKAQIENGTISPAMKELVETVAETRHVIETAKFEAVSDKNALKILELNNKIVVQTHEIAAAEQIPSVVAKAVSNIMDQGAAVIQPAIISMEASPRAQNAAQIVAVNENITPKPAIPAAVVENNLMKPSGVELAVSVSPAAEGAKPKTGEAIIAEKAPAVTSIKMGDVVATIPAAAEAKTQSFEKNTQAAANMTEKGQVSKIENAVAATKSSPAATAPVAVPTQAAPDAAKPAAQNIQPAKIEKVSVVPVADNQNTAPAVKQAEVAKAIVPTASAEGAGTTAKQADTKTPGAVPAQQTVKTAEAANPPSATNQNNAPAVAKAVDAPAKVQPSQSASKTVIAPTATVASAVKAPDAVKQQPASTQPAAPSTKSSEPVKPAAVNNSAPSATPVGKGIEPAKAVAPSNSANPAKPAEATPKQTQSGQAATAQKTADTINAGIAGNSAPQTQGIKPAEAMKPTASVSSTPSAKNSEGLPNTPQGQQNQSNPTVKQVDNARQTATTTAPATQPAAAPKPAESSTTKPQQAAPVPNASDSRTGTPSLQPAPQPLSTAIKPVEAPKSAPTNTGNTALPTTSPKPVESSVKPQQTAPVPTGSDTSRGTSPSIQPPSQPVTMTAKIVEGPKPTAATNTGTPTPAPAVPATQKPPESFKATAAQPGNPPAFPSGANDTSVKIPSPVSPVTTVTGVKAADAVSTTVQSGPSVVPSRGAELVKITPPVMPPVNPSTPKPTDLAVKASLQQAVLPVQRPSEAFGARTTTTTSISSGTGRGSEPARPVAPPSPGPKTPEPTKYTAPPVIPPTQPSPRPPVSAPPSRAPEIRAATPPPASSQGTAGRIPVQDPKPVITPTPKQEYKAREVKPTNPVNNATGTPGAESYKQNTAANPLPKQNDGVDNKRAFTPKPSTSPLAMPDVYMKNPEQFKKEMLQFGDKAKNLVAGMSSGKVPYEPVNAFASGLSKEEQGRFRETLNRHTETRFASEPRRETVLDKGFNGGSGNKSERVITETRSETVVTTPVKERTLFGDDRKDSHEDKLKKVFTTACGDCKNGEKRCPACPSNASALNLKR